MKKFIILTTAMLALAGGQAMAQRLLPGMSAVEVRADMANGFYTGSSRDCGYSFGIYYNWFKGNANSWSLGAEYLQTYKPYASEGRIPVAQFTCEVGYNLHLVSDYSQKFHLYSSVSALGGYETINWGDKTLCDGSTLHNGDAFIYGGALTIQADFFLSDNIALGAHARERFVFGNSTGHFVTQYGLHLKYCF